MRTLLTGGHAVLAMLLLLGTGRASAAEVQHIDGAALSPWWVLPFAGLLLSIAVLPQLAPRFWHHHFGKVAAGWAGLFLVPFAVVHGPGLALGEVLDTALLEYLPFIILLFGVTLNRVQFENHGPVRLWPEKVIAMPCP